MNTARTSAFYIANLGSEVARLQSAIAKGDVSFIVGALARTRTIFDKLAEVPLGEAGRAEIKILQEVVEDLSKKEPAFLVDAQSLQGYFLPFAQLVLTAPQSQ